MTLPPDVTWIRAAIARYEAPLLRFASALVGTGNGNDVVQDTFLRLVAARREDVEERLQAWLFTVCRNRALEIRRGRAREVDIEEGEEMASPEPTAPEELIQQDERQRLKRLLDELPERHREV